MRCGWCSSGTPACRPSDDEEKKESPTRGLFLYAHPFLYDQRSKTATGVHIELSPGPLSPHKREHAPFQVRSHDRPELVASIARPRGNLTGIGDFSGVEMHARRLELLLQAVPGLTRIAVLR